MSNDDKQTTSRAPQRFLALLRAALFETTPDAVESLPAAAPGADVRASADAEKDAARLALCRSLDEHAGAALREFNLQLEGLREVIGGAAARRRAALRVLALKGISVQALVLELERLLGALAQQREAFAGKLGTRRAAIERQRTEATTTLERETAAAEAAMKRLGAELAAEQTKVAEANARRDSQLALCEQNAAELDLRQRGFERAFAELRAEYDALKSALVNPESS